METVVIASSILNFLVVVFILWFFGRKPMATFLAARSETVATAIRDAELQYRDAEKTLREWQVSWDASEAHARQQLEEAKSAMTRLRENVLAAAKAEAERVKRESRMIAQSEVAKAREALQREVAEKSVRMAEAYLAGHLSDKDRQKLVSEYVEIVRNGAA